MNTMHFSAIWMAKIWPLVLSVIWYVKVHSEKLYSNHFCLRQKQNCNERGIESLYFSVLDEIQECPEKHHSWNKWWQKRKIERHWWWKRRSKISKNSVRNIASCTIFLSVSEPKKHFHFLIKMKNRKEKLFTTINYFVRK